MAQKKITGDQLDATTVTSLLPTSDQKAALNGASSPSSGNVFLTQSDITGGLPTSEIPSNFSNYDSDVSGTQTTTSTTFVHITGMDLTVTLSSTVEIFATFNYSTSKIGGGSAVVSYRLRRVDGTGAPEDSLGMQVQVSNTSDVENGSVTFRTTALPAGVYTFRPQYRVVSGGGSVEFLRGQIFIQAQQAPKGDTGAGVPVGGTTAQVLAKASNTDYDTEWVAAGAGGGSPLTTKGDLFTYDSADARLAVGSDGLALTANSGTTTGLEWATVGYRNIPQNSQSADYTCVLGDSGKHIYHPVADTDGRTYTIPANASVAYDIGTALTFINRSPNAVTIAITSDTLTWSPDGSTGSRTLAQYGVATAIKITSTEWILTGTGLT